MSEAARENLALLKNVEKALAKGRVVSAAAEAEILVRHYAKLGRVDFFAGSRNVPPAARKKIEKAVAKRVKGIPLGQILGEADFYGRTFAVDRHVLVPRPETEVLVEETLKALTETGLRAPETLDLCTGSGCIAVSLTLERPDCKMTALDVSPKALRIARKNVEKHGLRKKVRFLKGDLFEAFGKGKKAFWDVIVSNPPYIPRNELKKLPREVRREPRVALDGGEAGLNVIRKILDEAPRYLKAPGRLLLEIGKGQSRALAKDLARRPEYSDWKFVKDHTGIERILTVRVNG